MLSFTQLPPALEQGIYPLEKLSLSLTLGHDAPYSHLRLLLLTSMEAFSQFFSHQATLSSLSQDERRQLALIRRTDTRQQITLTSLRSPHKGELRRAIYLSMLALELSAVLAQRLPEGELRQALHFVLPEFLDELYRLSNLLMLEENIPAQSLLGGYAEIMPGRPLIACQRHPFDDVKQPLSDSDLWEEMAPLIMAAVVQEQHRFFLQALSGAENPLPRSLYGELSLIAEQHKTLFFSLLPRKDYLEMYLLCQYAEGYLYTSCAEEEENAAIRQLYLQEKEYELSHIKKAFELCLLKNGKVPPLPDFPCPLHLGPNKGYVRDMLQNAGVTALREGYVPVGSLPAGADFFRYQQKLLPHPEKAPSHQIIAQLIEKTGEDYRYEIAPHPLEGMRNRQQDHLKIGR